MVVQNYSSESKSGKKRPSNVCDLSDAQHDSIKKAQTTSPQGWLSRLLRGPENISSAPSSHSSRLAVSNRIYEFVTHDVKPGHADEYLDALTEYVKEMEKNVNGACLLGSWRVFYSKRNQYIHVWRYDMGYVDIDKTIELLTSPSRVKDIEKKMSLLLIEQENILTQPFGYWGDPEPREPSNMYELRKYQLRPGTMIEWGTAWSAGITYRRAHNQSVGGFFTKVGELYQVYHIWAYENLVMRRDIRLRTWAKPGWYRTVAYTVPLITSTESKIMVPTSLSQLK